MDAASLAPASPATFSGVPCSAWLASVRSNHPARGTGNGAGGGSGRSYYNEHDPKAAAWLRALIAECLIAPGDVDERSITEIRPYELTGYSQWHFFAGIGGWPLALRLAGWPDTEPVRTGSCPCQPFSVSGKQLGTKDERHIWPVFRDLLAFGEPTVCFGEQVASALGRDWLAHLRADMEGLGYEVGAADLCAAGVGATHIRQRLYWVANPARPRRRARKPLEAERREESGRPSPHLRFEPWPDHAGSGSTLAVADLLAASYGLPGRVGLLLGYGNAIVPQVAAEFVTAFCESLVRLGGGGGVLAGRYAPTTEKEANGKLRCARDGASDEGGAS